MIRGPALVLQRVVLRTGRGPLRTVWSAMHRAVMRGVAAYLVVGTGATIYARGSFAAGDQLYGVSDIDLAVVVPAEPDLPGRARDRISRRWARLCRRIPLTCKLVQVGVYEDADLSHAVAATTLTADRPTQLVPDFVDQAGLRMRPGLYGPMSNWRLMKGRERRPCVIPGDAQERRIAAWLELQFWWRCAFSACLKPSARHVPFLCVKLVAEPARILLWTAHGERISGRRAVLERALRVMPQEEEALLLALRLERGLGTSPQAPLEESLAAFVRLSSRIADNLVAQVADEGATDVRLLGGDECELVLASGAPDSLRSLVGAGHEPELRPLVDWRSRAWPLPPDETFALLPLDPRSPVAVAAAAAAARVGLYPALRFDGLLVLPATRGGLLRSVQCAATDPVSFALLEQKERALFPNVRGWSIQESTRRAVAEHRAWLERAGEGQRATLGVLGRLLTAARAALLAESVDAGEPELALTTAAVAGRLSARDPRAETVAEDAFVAYRDGRLSRRAPSPRTVSALRELVCRLPAFVD